MDEQKESKSKANAAAQRIEQARDCKPVIDPIEAMKKSFTGGNHGTIKKEKM